MQFRAVVLFLGVLVASAPVRADPKPGAFARGQTWSFSSPDRHMFGSVFHVRRVYSDSALVFIQLNNNGLSYLALTLSLSALRGGVVEPLPSPANWRSLSTNVLFDCGTMELSACLYSKPVYSALLLAHGHPW